MSIIAHLDEIARVFFSLSHNLPGFTKLTKKLAPSMEEGLTRVITGGDDVLRGSRRNAQGLVDDIAKHGIMPNGNILWDHSGAFDNLYDVVNSLTRRIAQSLFRNELSRQSAKEMVKQLTDQLSEEYKLIYFILLGGLLTMLFTIIVPLGWRLTKKRVVRAFISFSHSMEEIAVFLEKELIAKGMRVLRVPYKEHAAHQEIVVNVLNYISECDALLCIPGRTSSFVESEVMAASASKKAIFFLIPERDGTLPDTADKRYPIFKLENVLDDKFVSCIDFLGYCACDFRSTLKLLNESISICARVVFSKTTSTIFVVGLTSLFAVCYHRVLTRSALLESTNPEFPKVTFAANLAHLIVLCAFITVAFGILLCSLSFLYSLGRQIYIQTKVRYRVGLGQFQRKQWKWLAPGLQPGEALYESLFEISPISHHERT